MVTQIGQRFKNKVVLVTGAAHGIGRAIALRFGSEGGQVIVNDVNAQGTEDTVQTIITNGGTFRIRARLTTYLILCLNTLELWMCWSITLV